MARPFIIIFYGGIHLNTLEIARKFAALGETNEACKAYKLALNECQNKEPATEFECA